MFGSPFGTTNTLGDLVSLIIRLAFVISGLTVLFLFIIVGFNIIMKSGKTDPEEAGKLKKVATNAARGFAVIFVAYWIVRLIETIIGVSFITNLSL
jgi:hypothetical protein